MEPDWQEIISGDPSLEELIEELDLFEEREED